MSALIANGVDPGDTKKAQKAAGAHATETFEVIAREWHIKFAPSWASSHGDKIIRWLKRYVFPWSGGRPVKSITAPELVTALRIMETRGTLETERPSQQNGGQVFHYDAATGIRQAHGRHHRPNGNSRSAAPR